MKNFLILVCSIILPATMMAQETTYDKAELKQVKRLVKRHSLRKPIPFALRSDLDCMNFVHNMLNLSEQQVNAVLDSVMARNAENDFILKRVDMVVGQDKAIDVKMQIHREQLRSEAFDINYQRYQLIQEAKRREMPQAELIYLEYGIGGMLHYPLMPARVKKIDDQKAQVSWGPDYNPKTFETDADILKQLYEFIKEKHLYKLVSSYDDHSLDNLPDLHGPWEKLDGMSWRFEARFADGTHINVGGDDTFDDDLHTLQTILEGLIKKHLDEKGIKEY